MQSACRDRTPGSVLSVIRDSALQQIDLKNDVCDGRQRSRSTDAAACVRAQMSFLNVIWSCPHVRCCPGKSCAKRIAFSWFYARFAHACAKAIKNRPLRSGRDISWGLTFSRIGETGFEPAASCSQSKRATKLRHSPKQPQSGGFPEIIGTDGVSVVATGFEALTGLSQQASDAVIEVPVVSSLSPVHRFCLQFLERLETKSARCPPATLNLGCLL